MVEKYFFPVTGVILIIVFLMAASIFVNSSFEAVVERANGLKLDCSSTPTLNSTIITFDENTSFYCQLTET